MKKYITFNNFIALVALIMFFLGFCPFVVFHNKDYITNTTSLNLFQITFGTSFRLSPTVPLQPITLVACGGLIVAFIFMVLGILLNISKNRFKLGSLLAAPLYITAGILLCLAMTLMYNTNYNNGATGLGTAAKYYVTGVKYAISIMFIILGGFNIIDAIATFAKPKQVEVY